LFKVWICLLVEAKRLNEDGLLPAVGRLAFTFHTSDERMQWLVGALVEARLLEQTERGYLVHDWSDWQSVKPSATRAAARERVARHRAVTTGNAGAGVTHSVTPVTPKDKIRGEKSRKDEKRKEESATPGGSPSSAVVMRGSRIPPDFSLTPELNEYAARQGVNFSAAADHLERFRLYFEQTTKNATSRDWGKRWRLSLSRDIAEGRVRPDMSPATDETAAAPVFLTRAEESFAEVARVLSDELPVDAASALTVAVVERLGGWETVKAGVWPGYGDWLRACNRIGSVADPMDEG
jgi:hypothetical protein